MSKTKQENPNLPAVPADAQAASIAAVSVKPKNLAAVVAITAAQRGLAKKLAAIEEWLSLPAVAPMKIADNTWVFTLHQHGETYFDKRDADNHLIMDEETGEPIQEAVHLWLCTAQERMEWDDNAGVHTTIEPGQRFQIRQKKARLRDKIVAEIEKTLDQYGESIPNVTCRYAKKSANAPASWGRPVTFAVVEFE
jgi:hypothetical protein